MSRFGLVHRAGALFDERDFTGDENASSISNILPLRHHLVSSTTTSAHS